jgi:hypothetical protein
MTKMQDVYKMGIMLGDAGMSADASLVRGDDTTAMK